ncbi:hypothetical protein [Legionella fallonii]|uniref:EF-hand domain-containing protein n=1 Tax=Legionella fallonii LLAP-10 TaxID=1212491 RepID=A0A098G2W7_9GAMM|nr:hypothetical protein [Legionella fallonii]CEG56329.1 protein of unknown function [Legionella fallonii LLAP-10]
MLSGINGNYTALNYSLRSEAIKPANQPASMNEASTKKDDKVDQINGNLNQLPQHFQVNTVAKIEEKAEDNAISNQSDNSQPNDISSLISLIESSRKMSTQSPEEALAQVLPQAPESKAQLMITDANTLDAQKDAVLNELIDNFNKIDADGSQLITRDEALAFINKY